MKTRLLALLLSLVPLTSLALDMGISPARREFSLKPGSFKRSKFVLLNNGKASPMAIELSVMDVNQAEDGSIDLAEPGSTAWSAASWIKVIKPKAVLGPERQAIAGFELRVPDSARGGGYAAIVCDASVPQRQGASAITAQVRIPFVVYVTVAGTEEPKLRVVRTTRTGTKAGEPFTIHCLLSNDGNILVRPQGVLALDCGTQKRDYPINPSELALLPGASRNFDLPDLKGVTQAGHCGMKLALKFGGTTDLEANGDIAFHE